MSATPTFYTGLDIAQVSDFTALVTLAQTPGTDPETGRTVYYYEARHISRFPRMTPYPAMIAGLREGFGKPPLAGTLLVADATGVGRPVIQMLEEAGINADLRSYTITAGLEPGDATVPKKDLVGAVQAALGTRRLKITPKHPLASVLTKELELFRSKVNINTRAEQWESWRERDHDDCVLALALALWYAEQYPGAGSEPYAIGGNPDPFSRLPPGTFSRGYFGGPGGGFAPPGGPGRRPW